MPFKDIEARREYRRNYRRAHPEMSRRYRVKLKWEVIEMYGGKCACCGETILAFLSIDHIKGGGTEHRRRLAHAPEGSYGLPGGSLRLYALLRKSRLAGYQVLCFNCNFAKGAYGKCPHQNGSL